MGKIDQIAQERGETADTLIPRTIHEEGSVHNAAVALGVYPNAIRYWLKKHGRAVRRKTVTEVYELDKSHG